MQQCLAYIEDRVRSSLLPPGTVKYDRFLKLYNEDANKVNVEEFVRNPDLPVLVVASPTPEKVICTHSVPAQLKRKAIFFLKSRNITNQLKLDDLKTEVICSELTDQSLHNLSLLAHEVYFPLLSNPANRSGWSGPTSKEVMLKFSNFLSSLTMAVGQSKGQTLLPYPPPEAFDEDNLPEKDRVHLLETAIIQWAEKIQDVLSSDPESLMKQQGLRPDPLVEIQFWTDKASDLSSLHEQLATERMVAVLDMLKEMKSPYGARLESLSREVVKAREEALENTRFLRTLKGYFTTLRHEMDFAKVEALFVPLVHTMLLVWQHSASYNTKPRLAVLVQEIGYGLISQAQRHVSGEKIFRAIQDDNVLEAVALLKSTITTCDKFKQVFARYQVKASQILTPPDAWEVSHEVVFAHLNAFLERCNDMLEFCYIVQEFGKLERIYVGGTKGKQLTEQLRDIYRDFTRAVERFQHLPYDLMDVAARAFDDDFYAYRLQVKELERRLAAVIGAAFDDACTLSARFKLLESFESLVERPIVRDELNRRQSVLLAQYAADLQAVQELFLSLKDNPRIDLNLPPIAGALSWCRGLLDRVQEPMLKIRQMSLSANNTNELRELERLHDALCKQLANYEFKKIDEWASEIDATSEEKLQQPLLRRARDTRLLYVNFDEALVRMLREVKYFLSMQLSVPATALRIYEKAEAYRQQIGQLDLMVSMYNEMCETLHPVERPLVEKDMAHIDDTIERGISRLNWKSSDVNLFLQEALATVKSVYATVKIMRDNLDAIKKTMAEFASAPLIDRKAKPMAPPDFNDHFAKLFGARCEEVKRHQEKVTRLLAETNAALKVNKGSPQWRSYVEYVQDAVRDGLALAIANSVKFLCEQLDPVSIERRQVAPLLEVKLGLYANDVLFNAEEHSAGFIEEKSARRTRRDVWQIVSEWVEQLFDIGNIMARLDGSHYVGDLKKNEAIVRFVASLKKHLDNNSKDCENYRQEFLKYEALWKTDRNVEFKKFLSSALTSSSSSSSSDDKKRAMEDEDDDEFKSDSSQSHGEMAILNEMLPLDKFEQKILYYKELGQEIADKKSVVEVGWLRVNSQPVKMALQTWVSKWVHTYTSFLYNDVTRKLQLLESLQKEVNQGLTEEVPQDDSAALKKVLGYIHKVRSVEKSTTKMFQPLRDAASLLKKYGRGLDEYESRLLSEAPIKWDSTVNNVYKVKEKVNNLQNEEVDKIKKKVVEFEQELKLFRKEFRALAPFNYDVQVDEAYDRIADFHRKIGKMEEKAVRLNDLEKVFELPVSQQRAIKRCRHENKLLKLCWDTVALVKHLFQEWRKTPWDRIDTDALLLEVKKLRDGLDHMPNEVRSWGVYTGLQQDVKNLGAVLPLVNWLHSPCMEDRHWQELKNTTGSQFEKDESFCLANVLELELHRFAGDVEYIVELATKEKKIADSLAKIETNWESLKLQFGMQQLDDGGEVGMIQSPDEILFVLEDNMAMLQGMQGQGKNVEHFIESVTQWQHTLGSTESVLYDWLEVQSKWSALQAIFMTSADIRVQLPEDSRRFMEIDAAWKQLMTEARETPNVIEACSRKGRSELLGSMKVGLEQCQKSLFQYLETKRKAFPRFYFLSDAALLDILSNGHNPQAVQKHLGDCFDNIAKLKFSEDEDGTPSHTAMGMFSKDGDEFVDLAAPFTCEGPVEEWLQGLVQAMQATLRSILAKAKFTADHWEIERPRQKWLFQYPAQIALTASQIIWSEEVNSQFDAFADGNEQAMKEYSKVLQARLEALIQLVLGELTLRDRIKIMTLITVDVHNRDVVGKLIENKVQDVNSFAWQSQMRYRWSNEDNECVVRVADTVFYYQYEYIGNTGRLVITPLTDRCYITLTQALRLVMGGAPAGPAGTGKTETTKDLGRALGLPVYVFNCSEQMNVHSMGAIFKGLCQTGAWGCFDEFNRIPIEVLSVISSQFSCVLNALRERRDEFDFMGEMIKLMPSVGVFVTMNPGYAGRTALPENLRSLFRSCAMVVPDMELICENMLMSEGFMNARNLSKKFITLYRLAKELLSKQVHYDWGLRATKAVLMVAGSLKRAESNVDETRILMRSLRDFNMPKLVEDDKPIFIQLVEDLFPGLSNTERKFDLQLQDALRNVAQERGLQAEDVFLLKCVELAELLSIRHSIFIIGPAGAGKSELWRTLVGAYRQLGQECIYEVINPKAVSNDELYGRFSKTDWNDGILSTIMRNMSKNNPPYHAHHKHKWIMLDGDIDPNWIENLNSVMDDNKVLTLASNERIPLTKDMRLMFEVNNLDHATPATVSRAGIIFINAKDIGSRPFLDSWLESRQDEKEKSSLLALVNKYLSSEIMQEFRAQFKRVVPLSEVNMIRTLCYLLEGLLSKNERQKTKRHVRRASNLDDKEKELREIKEPVKADPNVEKEIFEANFVFACIWALGGALLVDKQHDMRQEFSDHWKLTFHMNSIKFPKEGTVFDYYVHPQTGKMTPWSSLVPAYEPTHDAYLVTKAFIPTVDTVRTKFLLDLLVSRQRPVLLLGNNGTGKTAIANDYLRSLGEGFAYCNVNLNYYTDAKSLQRIMEGPIDKRAGKAYGPAGTKKLIYFIDDLNMPFVDKYGTQTPLCLIRQHMDYGMWYDTSKLEKKEIHDVQYLACMNPTAGSFTIDERLQGQFATFSCLMPQMGVLNYIYRSVMDHHFSVFSKPIADLSELLVKATIELYDAISLKFMPSSRKFHYTFNLRDLSAVFQGLCLSQPSKVYDVKTMIKLWEHECTRVFADRLVSPQDVAGFQELLSGKIKNYFKMLLTGDPLLAPEENKQNADSGNELSLLFTSFHTGRQPIYAPVPSRDQLKRVLTHKLYEYNDLNPVMNLELFDQAMEHVCRIVRIIENPRGNALLVGVGGSGKQSLAKLASSICGYSVFQISTTQTYGLNDLKADLQELYKKAGVKNLPVTFLLTDAQIVRDEWLVYINDLLASGNIPDLFTADDKEAIFAGIRNEAKAHGVADTPTAMYEFFISQVRTNLHVVLCFSPVGESFRIRCRKFPAIINCCSIDWFHRWPQEALISVGERFLSEIELMPVAPTEHSRGLSADQVRRQIAEHMAHVHLSVTAASSEYEALERRFNHTTPKSFLELIAFYKGLLTQKRDDLFTQVSRLEKGIATLKSTASNVAMLKEELTANLARVQEKKEAADVLIAKTGVEKRKVEEQQAIAAVEAEKAKAVSEIANQISDECKRDLEAALPIMEAAKQALDVLSMPALTTLKSFASPPGNVLYVTNAVMILRNFSGKRDWATAKVMMKNSMRFLEDLKSFDATTISDDTLKKLQPILSQEFFTPEKMKDSSEAAANLCSWVVNIVRYNQVYKNVAPKIAAQKKATEELEVAQGKLRVVEEKVALMQQKLKAVSDSLAQATAEKVQVEEEAHRSTIKLELAQRLVKGLADENSRWGRSISELQVKARTLTGDVLVGAAFVSYIGAFNQRFRAGLWQKSWIPDLVARGIPLTDNVDPLHILANSSMFAKWKNEGLAADRMSLENGAIMTQCTRWPLMIDPQQQGVKWIRNKVKDLKVIQLGQKRWLNQLILAIQNGDTVLIENLGEEIDATLDPVLSRSIIQRGYEKFIKLGNDEVRFNDKFRLILQTKLANPNYKPEVQAQCTLINFIVTEEGLEEQLLVRVVNKEKPDLEEKRTTLVRAINDYMVTLTDLENELLERLSNAPEDILSDVALIEGLEKTKQAATEIEIKVQLATKQEVSINLARDEFRPVAAEGAWLYFLCIQLSIIDHMYQFSLDAFNGFFHKAMDRAKASDVAKERVTFLRESIRQTIFTWVQRGLFESHKLIFSSQLCFKLMSKGALSVPWNAAHFDYLVRAPKSNSTDKGVDWLPQSVWQAIQKLVEMEEFSKLASDMIASPNRFKEWYSKARPESAPLPLEWRKLDDQNPLMKLLIVRAMRNDRMTSAMENFVRDSLPNGKHYTECDAGKSFLDVLSSSLDDSTPIIPIFFILSSGADPVSTVELLAKKNGYYDGKFHCVALGQGQDVVAMHKLDIASREGHWVVLENIHLMPSWCMELEKKLDELNTQGLHREFRVFLSAEPSETIPVGLLERSIKLTNEPPQGLKQNLKRAFASFEKDEFEFKDPKVKSILFGLCHFHSVIIERIKFGSKGWNAVYPFNTGDLMNSATVLANYIDTGIGGEKIPWADLRYIFGEILYGGHITDDHDRLLCSTYLQFYMREELLDEMELFPFNESFPDEHFRSPPVLSYDQYFDYIDTQVHAETPVAFGLHPNAEIAVKTKQGEALFTSIMDLQPRSHGSGDEQSSPASRVAMTLASIIEKTKSIKFNLQELADKIGEERGPFQNVFMLECERMNILVSEIQRSLAELDLGLSGELQISERMEEVQKALFLGRVPETWARLAYPSQRPLGSWSDNLILRAAQLQNWADEPTQVPLVTNIAHLFNPQSFLTAIMQKSAQKQRLELDKLVIHTEVTRKTIDQIDSKARDGAYVTGLWMEGARWNWNTSQIDECIPTQRDWSSPLPVVLCKAMLADKVDKGGVYRCPVYKTPQRGPTYVFSATLRSKQPPAKWILAGVCLVLETDE